MSLTTKDALLGFTQTRYHAIQVEPYGDFRIRSLTERDRTKFEEGLLNKRGAVNEDHLLSSRRRLIGMCLVDQDGNLLLAEADIDKLAELDGKLTGALYDACLEHCGFSDEDIQEAVKNSEAIRVD